MRRLETVLLETLKQRKDEAVFRFGDQWYHGSEVMDWTEKNCQSLQAAGFTAGQRIMTFLPNCPGLFALALAVWSLGGALIPLNMRAGSGILNETINLLDPFLVLGAEGDDKATADVTSRPVASQPLCGALPASLTGHTGEVTTEDYAVFFATSGTTGLPKAVPLTHENLLSNVEDSIEWLGLSPNETYIWALPNFHSFGFTLSALLPQILGARCVVVPGFMPPSETLKAIDAGKCTVLFLVPAMLEFLKHAAAQHPISPQGITKIVTGGDRLNLELDQAARDLFGVSILEGYGTTECSPVVAANQSYESRKLGTIGKILTSYQWQVRDENGTVLPPETPGLLWVKGPSVFGGYYKAPEMTAERLTPDGWYNTGDVVKADEEGFITALDRATDIIIVGGFNVYPQEVERVLNTHPSVAMSAVVSMTHSVNGEIPRAFVVLHEGAQLTERELISFCKGKLANYKIPRKVDVMDQLPLSPSGKILRRKLRELA